MSDILAAKFFYAGERLGGLFYERFAAGIDHPDVAHGIGHMAEEENEHAGWYAAWLSARGEAPPTLITPERTLLPALSLLLKPQSLDAQLRHFSRGEAMAADHLRQLAARVSDPELRAIVEKTIPFERGHSLWYEEKGRHMLRPQDYKLRFAGR